jgi:hypothetical protein
MKKTLSFALLAVMLLGGTASAQPTKFVIIGAASQTAGTSQGLTIRADSAGLPAASYTGPKQLIFSGANSSTDPVTPPTVTDSGGVARTFGSSTVIQFVNGLATVNGVKNGVMSLYRAGSVIVDVQDGSISSAGTFTVSVSPGALAKFSLALSPSQQNGVTFTVTNTLTALDSWGNTVTTFNAATDNVTLTAVGLSGTITGLGSGNNSILDRSGDFASGVANLTGKLTFSGNVGTGTFTATSASTFQGLSGPVTISAGPAATIRVETKPDGSGFVQPAGNLASGDSLTVFAVSRDVSNNFVANEVADSWALLGKTGGLVDADLTASADKKSARLKGKLIGSAQINATRSVLPQTSSGVISVIPGPAAKIRVENAPDASGQLVASATLASGDSIPIYANARDAADNFVQNIPATWSLLNIAGGVVPADLIPSADTRSAKFKGNLTGSANIDAQSGALPRIDTGTITVAPGVAARLVLSGGTIQTAGTTNNLSVTARDAAGNVATDYTGNKSLTFSGASPSSNPVTAPTVVNRTGAAIAFGSATSLSFNAGIATVSGGQNGVMTLYDAGTDTISVTDGTIQTTGTGRLIVNVSNGTHTKFRFVLASPQTNGVSFTGTNTLTAQDAWGNTVPTFNAAGDPVTVTSALGGTITGLGTGNNNILNRAADFSSGVANLTGALTYTGPAGTGTFVATATGKSGTSNSVSIISGGATRLVITDGTTMVAGGSQNLTITARDGSGNVVTTYTGGKTLTFSGSPISPDSTKKPTVADSGGVARDFGLAVGIRFVNGVATVSGSNNGVMTLYAAGSATISATDGTISSSGADQLAMTVQPAALGKFRLSLATPQTNGVAFTGTNTLTAQDQYGNTVTTFNAAANNVTLTSTLTGIISGLGSGSTNVLNQAADFVSGVSNLAGKMKFTGTTGTGTFTARSADLKTGTSGNVLMQSGVATRYVITGASTQTAGTSQPLTITLKDSTGNTVSFTGDRSLTFSGANPSLDPILPPTIIDKNGVARAFGTPATITFTNGVASVSAGRNGVMRLVLAGVSTIAVTDGTLSSTGADRLVVTVSAADIEKFVVALTSPQVVAVAFTGPNTITAQDSFGNTLTTYNAAIRNVAITTPLLGTITGLGSGNNNVLNQSSDFVNGVANVAGRLRFTGKADTTRFTASWDGKSGVSGLMTIQPGPASRLVITGSSTMLAGSSQNLTITAKDSGGNTVTSYTGVKGLTFSGANPSPAPVIQPKVKSNVGDSVAFGSPTNIQFTNGVATVTGSSNGVMVLYRSEAATIAVTDGALRSNGSDQLLVTVNPGLLAKLLVSISNPQTNRVPFSGTNTLTASDGFGNIVTGFNAATDNVTMTSSPAGLLTGLGSLGNNVLDRTSDFTSGVASLTGLLKYEGAGGKTLFTASSSSGKSGKSDSITINNLAPTLSSVLPDSANRSQVLTVQVNGTNLYSGVTSVNFGTGVTVDSLRFTSSSSVLARITVSPTAALGLRSVSVTNGPPGGGTASKANAFEIFNIPSLFSLNPPTGVRGQTLNVVMTGTNFTTGVSTVVIEPATILLNSQQVISPTQIIANVTVPVGAADGVRQFSVTNSGQGGGKSNQLAFSVGTNPAPLVTSVAPDTGSRLSTVELLVRGQNFYSGLTSVTMGQGISVTNLRVDSTTQIRLSAVIADTAATGPRSIVVTNPPPGGGSSTLTNAFTVRNPRPTIANIAPQSANRLQTKDVTVTGTGFFKGTTTLSLGPNIAVDSLNVLSGTQLAALVRVDSAAAIGPRNVVVSNPGPGGGSDTLKGGFTVSNPSSILTAISPENVFVGSGPLQLALTGSSFVPESIVKLDTLSLLTTYVSTSQLRATIPASELDSARVFAVTVFTPGSGSSNPQTFTVNNPPPTLTKVTPDSLYRLQTVGMRLTGTGYVPGITSVTINPGLDIQVRSVVVDSSTQITVNLSVGASAVTGQRVITLSNPPPGGGTSTAKTFVIAGNPVPTLAGVQPAILNRLQTLDVVLTGANFINGVSTVNFGPSISVNSIKVDSSSQITANVSVAGGATTGSRNVTVTNVPPAGGTSAARAIQINNPQPIVRFISPSNGDQLQTLNVTVTGHYFLSGISSLSIGAGITVSSLAVVNDSVLTAQITISVTAGTGARDVVVTNAAPGGGSGVLTNGFVVGINPVPTLASVAPSSASRLQTLNLVFRGANFLGGVTTVDLGTGVTVNTVTVDSSTRLSANITVQPTAQTGSRTVLVVNRPPGGGRDSILNGLTIVNPLPTLQRITPASGNLQQTLDLVFHGGNFIDGVTSVAMGQGITVNSTTVLNDTDLVANITLGGTAALGQRSVSVSNVAPGGGTSAGVSFTVDVPASGVPNLQSPPDSTRNLLTTLTLRWSDVAGSSGYHLQVATDAGFQTVVLYDTSLIQPQRQVGPLTPQTNYYWRVRAKFGTLVGTYSSARMFTTGPGYPTTFVLSASVAFPTKAKPSDYLSSEYRILGLPGDAGILIPDLLGGSQGVDWQAYWDNGAPDVTKALLPYDGSDTYKFSVGRAFWVIRKGTLSISRSVPSAPLDTSGSVSVPLHSGWNLITNPYPTAVAWAPVLAANELLPGDPIYSFDGAWAQPGTINPYQGYYYYNTYAKSALKIPYNLASFKSPAGDLADGLEWNIHMTMETEGYADPLVSFGVARDATGGLDHFDHRRPRAPGRLPSAFFDRPMWDSESSLFASDIRPEFDRLESWDLDVEARVQATVRLTFSGMENVPAQFQVVLLDRDRASFTDLKKATVYSYSAPKPKTRFTILVGTTEAVQEHVNDILPREFALGDNFPNPFNPTTTIPVAIPRIAEVTLRVYSLLGEEVKTLQSGPLEPGRYWFSWDGTNDRGSHVASGVYLSRLTTSVGVSFTKKMLLLK